MQKKTNILQIIFGAVVIVNIALAGVFAFALNKIETLSAEVAIRQKEVASLSAEGSGAHQLATVLKEIEPGREKIEQYFIGRDNYIDFLDYLEGLSGLAGVTASVKGNTTEGSLRFTATYEGAFDNVMYYVALIESLPYNMSVDSVYVAKISTEDDLWRGGVSFSLPGSGGNN